MSENDDNRIVARGSWRHCRECSMQRAAEAGSRGSDDDGGDNRSRSLEPEELGQSVMHVY